MCPSTIPEESGGNFVRYVDTRSGQMGLLTDLPGYPFVTAPTGFAHDPTGTTLYYLQ
jgi:hypothetical protein